jgi:cytochrome c-type biogenesis protein
MGDFFRSTALDGSLVLALPVALLAGLVSFFSPCVIPLLPAYFSYATGLSGADLATGNPNRGRMVAGSALFVLGFGTIFVLLGVASGSLATWLVVNEDALNIGLGIFAIVMGVVFIGLVPLLQRDLRFHRVPAVGLAAAPVLGFLFGLGWQPCVGPTLTVILGLGYSEGTAGRGGLLMAVYALGLGIPFILAGLFWQRALRAFGFVRRHQQWVTRAGGVMMIAVGILILTGWWDYAIAWLQIHLVSDFVVGV